MSNSPDTALAVRQLSHGAPEAPIARSNNFDSIRLLAALLVLYSHQLFFLGMSEPLIAGRALGNVAVLIFFLISGYLVTESWLRDPHIVRFAFRRFLRIWPALAVATFVIALASAWITLLPPREYFGHATGRFVAHNLVFRIVYQLPGVFGDGQNVAMSAVNGSWWSIPLEVKCYLCLALLGTAGLQRRWISVLTLGVVAFLYFQSLPGHAKGNALHNLRYLCIAFFMTGVCARQFQSDLLRFRAALLLATLALLIGAAIVRNGDLALWIILSPLILITGSLSTPLLRSAGRFGDLSYGIYIYAYFVQQIVVRYWPMPRSPAATLAASIITTSALALCSWHMVEAPALRLKRYLKHGFALRSPGSRAPAE